MPRRTALTPAVSKALCEATREGYTLSQAAAVVGISPATVREWMRRGEGKDDREGTEPYATFATAMRRARAEVEIAMLASIQKAAEGGQWRAAAWYLERHYPERWGRGAHRVQVRNVAGRYEPASDAALENLLASLTARHMRQVGGEG